jgi:SNF2 family DNA or RNA helicase
VAGPASPLLKDPRFAAVIPRALLQNLVKHQAEGVVFLLRNLLGGADEPSGTFSGPRGCVLADGMGLGKSVQILTAAYIFMRECRTPTLTLNPRFSLPSSSSSSSSSFNALPARGRVLLIAPLTVHPQWVRECDRGRLDRTSQRRAHMGARHQRAHRAQTDKRRSRPNAVRAVCGGGARRVVAHARVKCVRRQRYVWVCGAESIGTSAGGRIRTKAKVRHACVHAQTRAGDT